MASGNISISVQKSAWSKTANSGFISTTTTSPRAFSAGFVQQHPGQSPSSTSDRHARRRSKLMPVTPLHIGPGTVFKSCAGKQMSLTVFALSQVLMDIEVIWRLVVNAERLHGFTNTIGGATVVLIPAVLVGRPFCEFFLHWWNKNISPEQRDLLCVDPSISWTAAWVGGLLGVYSHWFLDAIMHSDARALWPFSPTNPFNSWLSVDSVNTLCIGALAIGS